MLDDRQHVARAVVHGAPGVRGQRGGGRFDRGHIGLEAEQARADLVVQLHGGAPALVVLRGDQPLAQAQVLGARRFERLGERIEPIDQVGELLRLRSRQPHLVVPALEIGETLRELAERIEHAAEQEIQEGDHRDVEHQRGAAERQRVVPDLGDLVLRLGDDLDRADRLAIDDHRHDAALDRRRDQRGEPRRHVHVGAQSVGAADARTRRQRSAGGVLHDDAHVTHQPQLRGQIGEEPFRRHLLPHERDRLGHQQLGELHRGGDLDPRRRARGQDRHAARHQHGDHVDQDEDDEQLRPHRAVVPERAREHSRRPPQGRAIDRHLPLGQGVDERPPAVPQSSRITRDKNWKRW